MRAKFCLGLLTIAFFIGRIPAAGQLPDSQSDPLTRIREAAKGSVQACSATGETLCEQVAPKIVANAQGESPLADELHQLIAITNSNATTSSAKNLNHAAARNRIDASVVAWAVAAFRNAGIDTHTEKYTAPKAENDAASYNQHEMVVAEIRGREKPDESVLVGAHVGSFRGYSDHGSSILDGDCNAALVIEAARDIQVTGIRPRRTIRFVLFDDDNLGSWLYVTAHKEELDRLRAAILISSASNRVTGYVLNGRHDIEAGLREAMKPIDSMGANSDRIDYQANDRFSSRLEPAAFDFILEGIPTIVTRAKEKSSGEAHRNSDQQSFGQVDLKELKRNAAIEAVTAFGIAERAEPIGPRQSRIAIESLLVTSGLEQQLKNLDLWPQWESGQRGRLP